MHSEETGSVYIGGLNREVDSEALREYFSKYGEIKDAKVIRDHRTQESKGYGFVTFADKSIVDEVIGYEPHKLNGYKLKVRKALSKPRQSDSIQTKIIFIRGISRQTTLEDIIAYFERFGPIDDATLMIDYLTKRHNGHGFVTFHRTIEADRVCRRRYHEIRSKRVECEKVFVEEVVQLVSEAKDQEKITLEEESFEQESPEQVVFEQAALEQEDLQQETFEQADLEQPGMPSPNYYFQDCSEPNYFPPVVYAQPMPIPVYSGYPNFAPPMEIIMVPVHPYPTMVYPNAQPIPNAYAPSIPQYLWDGTNWCYPSFY